MNKKNRGFSLLVSIIASLILMGVSVGIISSIDRSLDQVNNIARSNKAFFAMESGREAALFHHNVRGAGLIMSEANTLEHSHIGATVDWDILGRSTEVVSGEIHEYEKITIPLYWDSSSSNNDAPVISNFAPGVRTTFGLQLGENTAFDFGTSLNVPVIAWSISRINNTEGLQTLIPKVANDGDDACANGSSFYCKSDLCAGAGGSCSGINHFSSGTIILNDATKDGNILPGHDVVTNIQAFMNDANSSNYEFSFQPILPFTAINGDKLESIGFKFYSSNSSLSIPDYNYQITSSVDFGNFEKEQVINLKENPTVGAFDHMIFQ